MKNYLVLHGHFYQPPREDPWTGAVPLQESAAPYHDWNKRITKECYAANSASRILDPQGRVVDIINNYRYLSFNFGPTLIQWLQREAPNVYQRIIEADRLSVQDRGGHGNALAQGYNHTILPLDTPEDIKTQIAWGMEDFQSHFSRDPEGLWLPEAAVSPAVADELIRQGIRFIVLSPWQGQAVRNSSKGSWETLHGKPVPSGRAYRLDRPSGSLNVLFYNHALASGISFEHYLRDAEALVQRFSSFRETREGHLIHAATDGEIYGHHEPFGDMCLAAFSRIIQDKTDLQWTNYGEYLDLFPPQSEVELRLGEDSRGSSWSCFHGVSRWYKDCGCSTGGGEGWNQRWRTPLREAFQNLAARIAEIYRQEIPKLSEYSPEDLRNRYAEVLTGKTDRDAFADQVLTPEESKKNARHSRESRRRQLLDLLEAQRYALYSFTSCGWFFSEISGLEPTQNLRYAVKAVRLSQAYTDTNLLEELAEILSKAQSNLPDKGTGADILRDMILAEEQGPEYPAAVFILRRALHTHTPSIAGDPAPSSPESLHASGLPENPAALLGDYRCTTIKTSSQRADQKAELVLEHLPTGRTYPFQFTPPQLASEPPQAIELTNTDTSEAFRIPVKTLPEELRQSLSRSLSNPLEEECRQHSNRVLPQLQGMMEYASRTGIPLPRDLQHMASMSLNCTVKGMLPPQFCHAPAAGSQPAAPPQNPPVRPLPRTQLDKLRDLLHLAHKHSLDIDAEEIQLRLSELIAQEVEILREHLSSQRIEYVFHLIQTGRKSGIEPEMTHAQNEVFFLIRESQEGCFQDLEKEDFSAWKKLKYLIRMGEIFGIDVDSLKERIFHG